MAIDINTLTPASLKAKEVATEKYVDTGIASIDNSLEIAANNNEFALKLGYDSYAAMVTAAASGQTVINGGYINTELLEVESLNAKAIVAGSVDAENITGNNIIGKNISGGTITGAKIIGSVISASYLDLDGELKILTNYYLLPGISTANIPDDAVTEGRYETNYTKPAGGDDTVLDEEANVYRIPSVSTVYEVVSSVALGTTGKLTGLIRAYNVTDAGHNFKAVKLKPSMISVVDTLIYNYSFQIHPAGNSSVIYTNGYSTTAVDFTLLGKKERLSWNLATLNGTSSGDDSGYNYAAIRSGQVYFNGVLIFNNVLGSNTRSSDSAPYVSHPGVANSTVVINGVSVRFTLTITCGNGGYFGTYSGSLSAKILAGNYKAVNDFVDGYAFEIDSISRSTSKAVYDHSAKSSTSIYIDNRI